MQSTQIESPQETAPIKDLVRKSEIRERLGSLDAFRGTIMLLMLNEATRLPLVARSFPHSAIWAFIAYNTEHVDWQGCSLHDLIQPGFSFLVGAAMPFSIASRTAKGQTFFTFEDTLTQIGLGYVFLFLLAFTRVRTQVIVTLVILIAFWGAFVFYPAPAPNFDYSRVGVPANWEHNYTGFLSHFNKNSNLSWHFDVWFLNLFPREKPFVYNEGGWSTLSFIPTLATMILGLLTGEWLKSTKSKADKLRGLVIAGLGLVLAGLLFQWAGICPIVKRIWTSSYTLYSGGLVILMLAGFYALIDWKGRRSWAFPLIVVGMNSIAIYVMSWTMEDFFRTALQVHLGGVISAIVWTTLLPIAYGIGVITIFWLILFWMYRRNIFLRI